MKNNPKDAVGADWMQVNVWRFLFKDIADARRNYNAFCDHFGPSLVLRRGREVRVQLQFHKPDLGVLLERCPGRKAQLLVHFGNMRFYCEWFVHRATVYDLTFDGKCRYSDRTKKCYLNPMVE
jgi:hypothetical protein